MKLRLISFISEEFSQTNCPITDLDHLVAERSLAVHAHVQGVEAREEAREEEAPLGQELLGEGEARVEVAHEAGVLAAALQVVHEARELDGELAQVVDLLWGDALFGE